MFGAVEDRSISNDDDPVEDKSLYNINQVMVKFIHLQLKTAPYYGLFIQFPGTAIDPLIKHCIAFSWLLLGFQE